MSQTNPVMEPLDLDALTMDPEFDAEPLDYLNELESEPETDDSLPEQTEPVDEQPAKRLKRRRKNMAYQSFMDDVVVQPAPDGLVQSGGYNRTIKPLRFPIATMSVGDSFEVDPDTRSVMRRALKADIYKLRKSIPGHAYKKFRIMRHKDTHKVYLVRSE